MFSLFTSLYLAGTFQPKIAQSAPAVMESSVEAEKNLPSPTRRTLSSYDRNSNNNGYTARCTNAYNTAVLNITDVSVLSDYNFLHNSGEDSTSVYDIPIRTLEEILDQSCRSEIRGSVTADNKQAQLPAEAPVIWSLSYKYADTLYDENGYFVATGMTVVCTNWQDYSSFFASDEELKGVLNEAYELGQDPPTYLNTYLDNKCETNGATLPRVVSSTPDEQKIAADTELANWLVANRMNSARAA